VRTKPGSSTLLALFSVAFTAGVGLWMVPPVLPQIGVQQHLGPAGVAVIASAGYVTEIIGYLLAGRTIARSGAHRALMFSLGFQVLGDLLFVLGGHLGLYLVGRVFQGLGMSWAWLGVMIGVIEERGRAASKTLPLLIVGFTLGNVVGPGIGGLGGIRLPFLVHAVLSLIVLAAVAPNRWDVVAEPFGFLHSSIGRDRAFRFVIVAWSIFGFSFGYIEGALPVHFATRLSQSGVGFLYMVAAVAAAVGAVTLGRLAGSHRSRPGVALGMAFIAGGLLAGSISDSVAVWVAGAVIFGLGAGGSDPNILGVITTDVPFEIMIGVQTLAAEAFAIGLFIGPLLGGILAEQAGFGVAGIVIAVPSMAFAVVGTSLGIARRRAPGSGSAPHMQGAPERDDSGR
jgi:MFS family permease